ncbi:DUF721 domain-containing protein [Thiohalomonas denitrificans]|uniref:DUF721 domain-containing protein n=1 Tax=Thiohalomonas denitrificans TaxID=415747 RepID=UPI0026EFEE99|nr:DciA family protein [Thiohalomonas denitrificans]
MFRPRNLKSLLAGGLGRTIDHARVLIRLEQQVIGCLDAKLASHCRVANVKNGILVLQVDTPAWAGRLRQQAPKLVAQLRETGEFASIEQIRVTVRPVEHRSVPSRPMARLSAESAQGIEAAAETIGDEALSAALRRLAKHRNSSDRDS